MSAPFSPVPDDQDQTIPAADPGAGAPASSPSTGVEGEEPDGIREHGDEADNPNGQSAAELDEALQGREEPAFRTPNP